MSAVASIRFSSDTEVPVIDLGPYLAGESGAMQRTAAQLREASEGLGFYFIANHGIAQSLIDRTFEAAARFHSLPLERKLPLRVGKTPTGYLPLGGQTQATSVHGKSVYPDRSTSFYIQNEFAADHPDRLAGNPWVIDNKWPEDLPGFKETALEYYEEISKLGYKILPLQALALDLDEKFFVNHDAFKPSKGTLRLLHYPPRDPALVGQYGIGPHTDYGYCTLLAQAKVPGLEILSRGGEWIPAPALDGHILVNNSDMCHRWTNDRFRSAPHRVINSSGQERYSIPFFFGVRSDVRLECLSTCQSPDNPAKYLPLSYGEYFAEIRKKNYDIPKEN
ncbi:MAG: isopenicillin N synthase family dioxygenase [Burkholderiales bacterium]